MRPTLATVELVYARDHGRCALCGMEVYGRRSLDFSVHHRRPAGMGGDRRPETHAPGNLVLLHGTGTVLCHGHVESRRTQSLASGLLVHRAVTPSLRSIEHAVHGRCWLADDGTVSLQPPAVAA